MAEPEEPADGASLEEQCEHWKMQAYEQYERFLELEMEHEAGGDTEELTERAETAEAELEELEAKYKKALRASDDSNRAKVRLGTLSRFRRTPAHAKATAQSSDQELDENVCTALRASLPTNLGVLTPDVIVCLRCRANCRNQILH